MGSVVGFTLLTLLSYIFFVLNTPFLIVPATLILLAYTFKPFIKQVKKIKVPFNLKNIAILIVFLAGITGQMAIIAPSGRYINGNLSFWSAHGHDGMWHIALMNQIKSGSPLQNPIMSGEKLVNYHFFSDVLPAMVSKYLRINDLDLYFRIFPFVYSLFLGVSVYYLTKSLTKSWRASVWATIFTYFAGSFGYLIGKGESVFWATQPQSSSGNPPQIISNFLILAAIYYLMRLISDSKSKYLFFTCVLLFGTISAFKIYAGVVLLGGLGIFSVYKILKGKDFRFITLTAMSGLLAAILYLPNSSGSNFLIFEPWWYIRTMIVEPSRLNLLDWELRRQTYIFEHNWKRVIWLEGLGFLIFFFGNLGMRFVGLWEIIKKNKESVYIVIYSIILLSILLPLLFLQKGVASNTAQFLQYFVLFFGILAGITAERLTKKIKILIPIFIILMIPTQLILLKDFYGGFANPRMAFAKIDAREIEALRYIKNNFQENITILTPPYNEYLNLKKEIPDIWDWFDTGYVTAMTQRKTYMDDYEQLDIMGYDYRPRLEIKRQIFKSTSEQEVLDLVSQTHANLIYFPTELAPKVSLEKLGLTEVFNNQYVVIWKIN